MLTSIVQPFELRGLSRLIQTSKINWRPGKIFYFYFNDTISREEHKTIYSDLRIIGMALSNRVQ